MIEAATIPPFPWASLESFTAAEAAATRRMRRALATIVRLDDLAAALRELTGARVDVVVRRIKGVDPRSEQGLDDGIGVLLAPADATSPAQRMLVEVEGLLGATLVTKALRARAPRITDPSRAVSPPIAGAVAAVIATAARKSRATSTLRVVAAGPAPALARDLIGPGASATSAWLTVMVDDDAFHARVTVPDGAAFALDPSTADDRRRAFGRLGPAKLAVPLVVATTLANRSDVGGLVRGDAFVPEGFVLRPDADGWLVGDVSLVPGGSERGLSAQLAEGGRLVVRGLLEQHPLVAIDESSESEPMTNESQTIEVLEDVPVVVRVELGTVEMTAREWTELSPGDIVALGRKVGAPAILRIGGAEIAHGELVVVDGEYAVRIVSR